MRCIGERAERASGDAVAGPVTSGRWPPGRVFTLCCRTLGHSRLRSLSPSLSSSAWASCCTVSWRLSGGDSKTTKSPLQPKAGLLSVHATMKPSLNGARQAKPDISAATGLSSLPYRVSLSSRYAYPQVSGRSPGRRNANSIPNARSRSVAARFWGRSAQRVVP